MINIAFNGAACQIKKSISLAEFLSRQQLNLEYSAVAINRAFVARSEYPNIILDEGDQVECVTPMQGG